MRYFSDYHRHVGANPERFFKSTIFQSPRMLLGMDCLEPQQVQTPHRHAGRDKFYYVVEGRGRFTIDEETHEGGPGTVVWAPADTIHSVVNIGDERLVMLIGMAPEPD
jgi:quercetin dioxygenase-like cupin family protein